jgi:hypothetical protein
MHCYNHRTTPAIAVCRACGKGVCQGCAHDTGTGIACRDSCEARVQLLNRIVDNNERVMKTANEQARTAGVAGFVTGGVMLAVGWMMYERGQEIVALMCVGMGLPLALMSLGRLFRERYPMSKQE